MSKESDRELVAELKRLYEVLRQIRDMPWMGEDHDGNDKAAATMRRLAEEALPRERSTEDEREGE